MKFEKIMTLDEAIAHAKEVANHKCDECGKEHAKLAKWLTELQGFKDETPITRELLEDNFDEMNDELYNIHLGCDIIDIYIQSEGIFHIIVKNKGSLLCHTLGQLRMFLTLCGLGDFIKQLKSKEV